MKSSAPFYDHEIQAAVGHMPFQHSSLPSSRDELNKQVQSQQNSNEPELNVEALSGLKLQASGRVAYPIALAVSFLVIFLTINQLSSNIKGTGLQAV